MTDLYYSRFPQQCSPSEAEQWNHLDLSLLHSVPASRQEGDMGLGTGIVNSGGFEHSGVWVQIISE